MKTLAVMLGILVFATHYGAVLIFDDGPTAFYVARGVEGTALFCLLAWIFRESWPVMAVCAWGAVEEVQTSACGWADVQPDRWSGTCIELVGPIPYALVAATAALWLVRKRKNNRDRQT